MAKLLRYNSFDKERWSYSKWTAANPGLHDQLENILNDARDEGCETFFTDVKWNDGNKKIILNPKTCPPEKFKEIALQIFDRLQALGILEKNGVSINGWHSDDINTLSTIGMRDKHIIISFYLTIPW